MKKAQLVCRKWYRKFVPQTMLSWQPREHLLPFAGKHFRLAFEDASMQGPLHLALFKDKPKDVRETGLTFYISAGSSAEYRDFSWQIDNRGRIKPSSLGDKDGLFMAAHRYYGRDFRGPTGTNLICTNVQRTHENFWRMKRVGNLDRQKYEIVFDGGVEFDSVKQKGWCITAAIPTVTGDQPVFRDEENVSRYVHISPRQEISTGLLPGWLVEPLD